MKIEGTILKDVVILRLLLIVLLVLYHSFCIFNGAWQVPNDYPQIPAYYWTAQMAYSFMLETFVFISGYLYGDQVLKKGTSIICIKGTILRKGKRLLLPCIFFGTIYYLMFYELNKPLYKIVYTILNGAGHLWFLPMLFWCFAGIYIIEKANVPYKTTFSIIIVAACLCSFLPLPFRMGSSMYYFLFFYLGYCINRHRWDISRFFTRNTAILLSSLWLISLISFDIINKSWGGEEANTENYETFSLMFNLLWKRFAMLCYASFGTAMIFCWVNCLWRKNALHVTPSILKLSSLCFGVYIYQQFILKILYYQLDGLNKISPSVLPWMAFFVTLFFSLFLSHCTLKTRFGKFLIG